MLSRPTGLRFRPLRPLNDTMLLLAAGGGGRAAAAEEEAAEEGPAGAGQGAKPTVLQPGCAGATRTASPWAGLTVGDDATLRRLEEDML